MFSNEKLNLDVKCRDGVGLEIDVEQYLNQHVASKIGTSKMSLAWWFGPELGIIILIPSSPKENELAWVVWLLLS